MSSIPVFSLFRAGVALLAAFAAAALSLPAPKATVFFRDHAGTRHALQAPEALAVVFVFLSTECPIANAYSPRLAALYKAYRGRGVRFFGVYPNRHEGAEDVKRHAGERGFTFPLVRDDGPLLARRLGATVTPEVAVLDRKGVLRYRGRIDDHQDAARVESRDLQAALNAVLGGKAVARSRAAAFGCAIRPDAPAKAAAAAAETAAAVTYTRDVAPILQHNCVSCHRSGEVGPFRLETYAQAVAWAKQIKDVTARRKMPPWKADSHGEFLDEKRLTPAQIATLAAWADSGTPEGNPKDLPAAPAFKTGWKLGTPDVVLEMPETYTLPAEGTDIYQCFVIPSGYDTDRWVAAVEFQPGNRAVVHHISAYLDTSGTARKLDALDPGPGYRNKTPANEPGFKPVGTVGGWIPGHEPRSLPPGVASLLPRGADIVLEVHYHLNGKPETDRTRFGFHWAKGPVDKQLQISDVHLDRLRIPPGDPQHMVISGAYVPEDITLFSITPHMHFLGKTISVTAVFPDRSERKLIDIPDWDFRWQPSYRFKERLRLPKGTRLDLVATYDNTAANPNQPNKPPRTVVWGGETTDEMCIVFIAYTADAEHLTKKPPTNEPAKP